MVLQRDKPNTVWGWATPGKQVTVHIAGNTATGTASDDGRWEVRIDPPPVGGPYQIVIEGPTRVVLSDVLVGDVWLCSGQSNMDFRVSQMKQAAREIERADYPNLRLFSVANQVRYQPAELVHGQWRACTPDELASETSFSAVGYVFGETIQRALHIPVGLIHVAVGGTPAESWTNPDTLADDPDFSEPIEQIRTYRDAGQPEHGSFIAHWYDAFDAGVEGRWHEPATDLHDWQPTQLANDPFAAFGLADTPAVVWFAVEIDLPDSLPPGRARLKLGRINLADTVYVNGKGVGCGSRAEIVRDYALPPGLLTPGKNRIAIRVFKPATEGGFLDAPAALIIRWENGHAIALGNDWKAKVGVDARPPHPLPLTFDNWPTMPGVLFDGMIRPLAPLTLAGVLWYQGESNNARPEQYRTLLPKLISDWRQVFAQGAFPFYIVQLPAYGHRQATPDVPGWAGIRDAQAHVARTVENTGLAVTIDTGDADDIHPPDKRPIGERLAQLALADHYKQNVVGRGPVFKTVELVPSDGSTPAKLRIRFDHTHGGLVTHGGMPAEFSIAGAGDQWHWADAKLDGDTVLCWSPAVAEPRRVRYAWQSNPAATLYNAAGLPAAPFEAEIDR